MLVFAVLLVKVNDGEDEMTHRVFGARADAETWARTALSSNFNGKVWDWARVTAFNTISGEPVAEGDQTFFS